MTKTPKFADILKVAAQRQSSRDGDPGITCSEFKTFMDAYQADKCAEKSHAMEHSEKDDCPCSGDPMSSGVDLIVLVDGSGSMSGVWSAISDAVVKAVDAAIGKCKADARVEYLFVDRRNAGIDTGALGGTIFNKSHEAYLSGIGYPGPFATEADNPPKYASEQGTEAIIDLCRRFDWRKGACRSVLYVSDEVLSTINERNVAASLAAANGAIAAAAAANVAVFTHFVGNDNIPFSDPYRPAFASHYQLLSTSTGGTATIDTALTAPSAETYVGLIAEAICDGCGAARCRSVPIPEIKPCIAIRWGDSECDCMEGDDHEALCITVSNCHDNVTFQNLQIGYLVVTDENGNLAPSLPDGSPSSWIYPTGPVCFGSVGPCVDGKPCSVSREAVIINRGLPPGKWFVHVGGLCYDVAFHYLVADTVLCFEVCKN